LNRRGIAVVAIAALVLGVAPPARAESGSTGDADKGAERIVQLLVSSDPRAAADHLHYPPSYSKQQRADDVAAMRGNIGVLIDYFGTVSKVHRETGRVLFYEAGGGGGDGPYWQSLSPLDTQHFFYAAEFSKLGPGIVHVVMFRHPTLSAPEVHLIAFGLRVARPDAKQQVVGAMKAMMRGGGMPLPDNIDELLERTLTQQDAGAL
jgi:hypothetical protein